MAALHRRARRRHCSSSVCSTCAIVRDTPWRFPRRVSQGTSHAPRASSVLDDRLRRGLISSFATPPAFTSRAGVPLFRPPAAAPFSFMKEPFMFQARPGPAHSMQLFGRAAHSAPGGSNVVAAPSVASAFALTTVTGPHSAGSVFPQPSTGLLTPLVGPMALIIHDRPTQGSMSTDQHSDAFTSWSHRHPQPA